MTISPHLILSVVLLGPGIIACYIFFKKIQQNRIRLNEPIDADAAIKLPGHSLLEKIEEKHEEVADKAIFLIFPTLIHALVFFVFFEQRSANEWTFVFLFGIETGIIALLGFKLWRLLKELQQYRLGYRGEIFVSQILQPLTLMGYRVYHDLELENFKIDHILINDGGVFCLETEIPEKPKASGKMTPSEVSYNGRSLQYPWGEDSQCLFNLQKKASALAKVIRQKTGQPVPVYPMLLLPGWKINRTGKGAVNVINPREIPAGLFYFPEYPMKEDLIDKIETVLTEKCMEHFSVMNRAS
jgi:hypothetical protein